MADPATIPEVAALAADRPGPAVVDGPVRWSGAELLERARGFAAMLAAGGARPGSRVGIRAPNGAGWVAAMLGAHTAGASVVPLNPRAPATEVEAMVGLAGAEVVLAEPDLAAGGAPVGPEPAVAVDPADESHLQFTSGSTGDPKGVPLRHGAVVRSTKAWCEAVGLRSDDRYLCIAPFTHIAGHKTAVMACLTTGATLHTIPRFDPAAVLALVERERITVLPGPPTLFEDLLGHPDRAGRDLSSLRLCVTGAARVPERFVTRLRDELGFDAVLNGYGLTEATGVVTITRPDDPVELIATTSGRPIEGAEVRIGEDGEIQVRGEFVMTGYVDAPDATAAAFTDDGWLRTGDVGELVAGVHLAVTDRLKDIYISGGFNVAPAEVERVLRAHPAVERAAVVGVADARLGETGAAFVVGDVTAAEIDAWCRQHLAGYKAPGHLHVVAEIPLNPAGKIDKRALRALATP